MKFEFARVREWVMESGNGKGKGKSGNGNGNGKGNGKGKGITCVATLKAGE